MTLGKQAVDDVRKEWDVTTGDLKRLRAASKLGTNRDLDELAKVRIKSLQSLHFPSVGGDRTFRVIGLLVFIFANLAGGLSLRAHMQRVLPPGILATEPRRLALPFLATVLGLAGVSVVSSLPLNLGVSGARGALHWTSLCFSGELWLLDRGLRVAILMPHAYAMAHLWVLGSPALEPPAHEPENADQNCGQRKYLRLMVTWSLVGSLLMVLPAFCWLAWLFRNTAGPTRAALAWSCAMMLAALAIVRVLLQVYRVRSEYEKHIAKVGADKRQAYPPDPTTPILGPLGFELPRAAIIVLAAFWAIMQWSAAGRELFGH